MGWSLQATALLALFSLASASTIHSCLNGCLCDTATRHPTIRCDNLNLTHFPLPVADPQENYNFLALSCNGIVNVPDLLLIQKAYPDLHGVDLMGNPGLNCTSLKSFEGKLAILSHCNFPQDHVNCLSIQNGMAPDKKNPSKCDQTCKRFKKLEELWDQIKQLAKQMNIDKHLDWFAKTLSDFTRQR